MLAKGLTKNAGRKNDPPICRHKITRQENMKMPDMKMQNMNMTDQNLRQGVKLQEKKTKF